VLAKEEWMATSRRVPTDLNTRCASCRSPLRLALVEFDISHDRLLLSAFWSAICRRCAHETGFLLRGGERRPFLRPRWRPPAAESEGSEPMELDWLRGILLASHKQATILVRDASDREAAAEGQGGSVSTAMWKSPISAT
jgi:hypothetical protein